MVVWIFFLCSPDCPKQPRIEYPFYRFLYPMICGTISGVTTDVCPLTDFFVLPHCRLIGRVHISEKCSFLQITLLLFLSNISLLLSNGNQYHIDIFRYFQRTQYWYFVTKIVHSYCEKKINLNQFGNKNKSNNTDSKSRPPLEPSSLPSNAILVRFNVLHIHEFYSAPSHMH